MGRLTKNPREQMLVSFSGIDGAGKSTQIEALEKHLFGLGLRVRRFTFWDDIAAFRGLREFISIKIFKGDRGVGSPDKPIQRRDKDVTSWYVTALRLLFYCLDTRRLRVKLQRAFEENDVDFIVFDRYIYDELANLPLHHWLVRLYVRALLRFVPRPNVAFLMDADPEAARARKPEYSLEFLRKNRNAYLTFNGIMGGMTVISPLSVEPAIAAVQTAIAETSPGTAHQPLAWNLELPGNADQTKC